MRKAGQRRVQVGEERRRAEPGEGRAGRVGHLPNVGLAVWPTPRRPSRGSTKAGILRSMGVTPPSEAPNGAVHVDRDRLVSLLRRLVEADSTNPPGGEAAVVAVLADHFGRHGLFVEIDEVLPGRPNLSVAIGRGGTPGRGVATNGPDGGAEGPGGGADGSGPVLLLSAHTDTMPVGPSWSRPPFAAVVEDGELFGRGACDAKGGLAAMAEAVVAVYEARVLLRGRLVFDAVVDEETGGAGTLRALAAGRRADWAIVAEPTDLAIARTSNGQLDVSITVRGKAAHGSTPDEGRSAIGDAAAVVAAFEAEHERLRRAPHPLLGSASYSVGTIHGGVQASIVAAECLLEVDRRILPGASTEDAVAEIDAILARVRAERPGMDVARDVTLAIPPVEVAAASPVCIALAEALVGLGAKGTFGGLRATSDAAWLAATGVEAVVFGPGSLRHAHGPDERVALADVELAACALAETIVKLLG
jgi:acetylornithine deacetylase/succinyl-diaminopimelate desuccinylase family protein